MTIKTERLILRPPESDDVNAYMRISNSPFVLRYNAMTPKNTQQVHELFKEAREREDMLLMQLLETNELIGAICMEEDSIRWGVASKEISYFLGEQYARKGYMKEALTELIRYLFQSEKLSCVAARAFAPNIASRKLLESLGFHLDGIIPHCVKGYADVIFDDTLYSMQCTDL